LLWALPIIGAIIALYLLKMRREDLRVPATFLWPPMTSDIRANAPFQKLRFSYLLLLQLLAAFLIVVAVAGPLRRVRGLNGGATVVVLDDSASMQATDIRPTRFADAIERVKSAILALNPGDRMALILAGSTTRIVFPLTNDKAQMRRSLASLAPSDAPSDMSEALRLAASLVSGRPSSRIVVLSDGNFPPVTDFSPGRAAVSYESIGTSDKNVAITAFNSSLTPGGLLQCFAAIRNYSGSPMSVAAALRVDGDVVDAKQLTVPASQTSYLTFNAPPAGREANLTLSAPGDILPADDEATIFLKGQGTVRTLLVTSGDLFLENALSLDPAIRLEKAADVPAYELTGSPGGGSRYDLVIFDNLPPRPVKAPAIWSLGVPSSQFGVTQTGVALNPRVIDFTRTDPILRFADLTGITIQKAERVAEIPGAGAHVIVHGSDGPLVVSSEQRGRRTLYSSWSVLDSDFPLRVCFPIFVANSVAWLTTGGGMAASDAGGVTEVTGHLFDVATPDGRATLIDPNGDREALDASSGVAEIRSANRVGIYQVAGPTTHTRIAVNLLNESASDVRPKEEIDLSGSSVAATRSENMVLSEFWRPIVCLALLVLAGEWWLFVRRS
jgi:hypothetical protein